MYIFLQTINNCLRSIKKVIEKNKLFKNLPKKSQRNQWKRYNGGC